MKATKFKAVENDSVGEPIDLPSDCTTVESAVTYVEGLYKHLEWCRVQVLANTIYDSQEGNKVPYKGWTWLRFGDRLTNEGDW